MTETLSTAQNFPPAEMTRRKLSSILLLLLPLYLFITQSWGLGRKLENRLESEASELFRKSGEGEGLQPQSQMMGGPSCCSCCCLVAKSCPTLWDPMIVGRQAPLSTEFSRPEYWSGLPFPSLGDLPDQSTMHSAWGAWDKRKSTSSSSWSVA